MVIKRVVCQKFLHETKLIELEVVLRPLTMAVLLEGC